MKYPLSIYVAGSSAESARAQRAVDLLKSAGLTVTSTWLETIASVGDANPATATYSDRRGWSLADLAQIDSCDLLWLLAPDRAAPSRGAWLEVGYAHAKGKIVVCSGDFAQSIFCALGTEKAEDVEAFAVICRMAREGYYR